MSRRGFTVVEMVVVLVVLAITAAVVAPALGSLGQKDDVQAATDALTSLLSTARNRAERGGFTVAVSLDVASGRYVVRREGADGENGVRGEGGEGGEDADALAAGELHVPPGAHVTAAGLRARFVFHALGDGSGDVLVVQAGGRVATVTVDRWTGEPRASLP